MPTHDETAQFLRDFATLSPAMRARFLDAVRKMVNDMKANQPFRPSLRVKGVQGILGICTTEVLPRQGSGILGTLERR